MSDTSNGPGWWLASDGKWYPPHLHPGYNLPHPSQDPQSYGSQGQPSNGLPFAEGQAYGSQPYAEGQAYGSQPYAEGQPYGAQPYGAQPYGAQPYGAQPSPDWSASGALPGASWQSSEPTPGSTGGRRWARRPLVLGAAMVLVLAAVAGVLLSTLGSSTNADGAIISAVNSAIGDKTAHIQMSTSVTGAGATISMNGSGSVDFTNNALQLSVNESAAGRQLTMQLIYVGGIAYVGVPQIAQLAPGKSWVSVDLSSLSQSAGMGTTGIGGNPLATLHALAQQGNSVSSLGSSIVDNQTVDGYSVTFNQSTLQNEMNNLPDWMKQSVSQVSNVNGAVKVYLTPDGRLVRESVTASEQVGGTSIGVDSSYDYSDYGAAVSVTAPPADQVLSINQFLQAAGSSISI